MQIGEVSPSAAKTAMGSSTPSQLKHWQGLLLFLGACVLFLIADRQSYQGYFHADDLDTLGWTQFATWRSYVASYFSWRVEASNFRPVGHFYYYLLHHWAGLNFPLWLAALHVLHFCNVLSLWFLLRRLQFGVWSAGAGCLLFGFHPALFDAYWKPMFVFDVACGLFCLLSLLCYVSHRWILSLICFYTAYRCKEVVIMLPLVLAGYELWLGEKRWKRLVPFFLVSLCFGMQALLLNHSHRQTDYALKLSLSVLDKTGSFYNDRALPVFGSAVSALFVALWTRDRRAYVGYAAFWLLLIPLLILPGRMFGVYLYVPLIGMAIVIAAAIQLRDQGFAAAFALIWLVAGLYQLHGYAREELRVADDIRNYVGDLRAWFKDHAPTHVYRYRGLPTGMNSWGVPGSLAYLTHKGDLDVASDEPGARPNPRSSEATTVLVWDEGKHHVYPEIRAASTPD